uniref:NADH dehydrogenase subunit 4L n=1 Tax=Antonbruunia milenae TaxID=3053535 RepID=UPI0030DDFCBE
MLSTVFYLGPLMSLMSILCVSFQRKNIFMILMALEAMILTLMFVLGLSFYSVSWVHLSSILFIMSFGACESSLGLACLVAMIRSYGNDRVSSLNLVKC